MIIEARLQNKRMVFVTPFSQVGLTEQGSCVTDDLGAGIPLGKGVSKQAGLLCNSIYFFAILWVP